MKEVFARLDRCLGCRSCQLACAVEHSASKNLFGAVAEKPVPRYRLFIERTEELNIPITCRHCDPAPCLDACIAGAVYRDDQGAVRRKKEQCVGCWTCIMVCPYGVVSREKDQKIALKCDRCHNRDIPACVDACPTKALVFAEAAEFGGKVRKVVAGMIAEAVSSDR